MRKAIFNYRNWKVYESVEISEADVESTTTTVVDKGLKKTGGYIKPQITHLGGGKIKFKVGNRSAEIQMAKADDINQFRQLQSKDGKLSLRKAYKRGEFEAYKLSEQGWSDALKNAGITANVQRVNDDRHNGILMVFKNGVTGVLKYRPGKYETQDEVMISKGQPHVFGFFPNFLNAVGNELAIENVKDIQKVNIFDPDLITTDSTKVASDPITITDDFEMDSAKLSGSAIASINKLVKSGVKSVKIGTGASQDGNVDDVIEADPKVGRKNKMKRADWDKYLVNMRYKTLKAYLEGKGIKVSIHPKGLEGGKYKVYGVFGKIGKNPANRKLKVIPSKI